MPTDYGSLCCPQLEFMQWADNTLLSALSSLPEDKLLHDHGNSFKSLFDTLNHICLAELIWLRKVTVDPNAAFADLPVPPDLGALTAAWQGVHQNWLEWARSRSGNDWSENLHFQTRIFGELTMPYWQIVMHVVNHGSYHRGQLVTMMRQAGIAPPSTDLIIFYRSKAASAVP